MIYAKCFSKNQVCKTESEFDSRIGKENVYFPGKTTTSSSTLSAVPMNYIFQAIKFGTSMGVLSDYKDEKAYPLHSVYLPYQKDSNEQTITEIYDLNTYEGLEYVFKTVGNSSMIQSSGYIRDLTDEAQKWFAELYEKYLYN